jgi:putative sterol carrier protein
MATTQEIFDDIRKRIQQDPEATKANIGGTFKFVLTGDLDESWIVDCKDVDVRQSDDEAECTIRVTGEDFMAIRDGSLDGMQAFMMGKLEVEGDMGLAMKLQEVL